MYRLEKAEKRLGFIFVFSYFTFAPYVFSYLFAFLISKLSKPLPLEMIDPWFNLFYDGSMLLIGLLIFRRFIIKNIKHLFNQKPSQFLKAVGSGFILLYAINFIVSIAMSVMAPEVSSLNQSVIEEMTAYAPIQLMISSIILAPILEELVFRVGVFQSIYEKSEGLAYFMSSFLFGFVHISQGLFNGDWSQSLYLPSYALLGATFAYMYEKNKNIFVPMSVHMLNNLISMFLMFG